VDAASAEEVTLSGAPASVRAARAFVHRVLTGAAVPDLAVERATLLVSELVTNAVLHTDTDICVRVRQEPIVRVEVEDEGGAIPEAALPAPDPLGPVLVEPVHVEELAPGGLGLAIVARLASRWGVSEATPRKTVWFELDTVNG
jgi:anti-sigma regulatory factor (Ser/Thr protein kinase)